MKCEECTTNALEELLDGELDARRAAQTRAHLATCAACARAYDELLEEGAMYAAYERELDVTPQALWSGIEARITAEGASVRSPAAVEASLLGKVRAWLAPAFVAPRFSPALTAALMLLAVGATAVVMRYMNSQPAFAPRDVAQVQPTPAAAAPNVVQPTPDAAPSAVPQNGESLGVAREPESEGGQSQQPESQRRRDAQRRRPVASPADAVQTFAAIQNNETLRRQRATERLVREAESKYLAAIRMLSEDVERKRTRLDPQVAARFDETLATIDRSIAETRRTVLRQRNDPVAVQYMLSAYAKKVEVMREMATLD